MIKFIKRLRSNDDKDVKEQPIIEEANDAIGIDNSEELIAVIAAAVAASMGLDLPDINIQSIRRIPQNTTPWADMGRKEQLFSRF